MGAPLGGGFQVNVFLRDGDTVYRTYNTQGRGTEQLSHSFPLIDLLPYGRQEEWQDSPPGWPQSPTYSRWAPPEAFAAYADAALTTAPAAGARIVRRRWRRWWACQHSHVSGPPRPGRSASGGCGAAGGRRVVGAAMAAAARGPVRRRHGELRCRGDGSVGRACVLKVAMPLDAAELAAFDRSVLVHELAAGRGLRRAAGPRPRRAGDAARAARPQPRRPRPAAARAARRRWRRPWRAFWHPVDPSSSCRPAPSTPNGWAPGSCRRGSSCGRPCPREVIDRALACCDDRAAAFDPARAVLVHGDAHGWNTLEAAGGFKLVDPEGVRSEPAHDLGVPMREYNEPLLAGNTSQLVRQTRRAAGRVVRRRSPRRLAVGLHRTGVDRSAQPARLRGRRRQRCSWRSPPAAADRCRPSAV